MLPHDKPTQESPVLLPKIIRKPTVRALTGLSDATIWRREHWGDFPHRVSLGGRAVGWRYEEVVAWLERRVPKTNS